MWWALRGGEFGGSGRGWTGTGCGVVVGGEVGKERGKEGRGWGGAYSAHDGVVVREVRFAVLAAEDAVRVQVDVVFQPHCRAWLKTIFVCCRLSRCFRVGGGCGDGPGIVSNRVLGR